jgi:hypothetical protein
MITERDIFFSIEPEKIVSADIVDNIYKKYRHLSLISLNPPIFFDYITQSPISLDELNYYFDDYPPMALQKLGVQLESNIQTYPLQGLLARINDRNYRILTINNIIE